MDAARVVEEGAITKITVPTTKRHVAKKYVVSVFMVDFDRKTGAFQTAVR